MQQFDELAGEGMDLHVTDSHILGFLPTEEPWPQGGWPSWDFTL